MEPACSKACPTKSIQFGTIRGLREQARKRVEQLHEAGEKRAYLYGAEEKMLGGLNSFYVLVDKPEVYHLVTAYEDAVESRSPIEEIRVSEAEVRARLQELTSLIERLRDRASTMQTPSG